MYQGLQGFSFFAKNFVVEIAKPYISRLKIYFVYYPYTMLVISHYHNIPFFTIFGNYNKLDLLLPIVPLTLLIPLITDSANALIRSVQLIIPPPLTW